MGTFIFRLLNLDDTRFRYVLIIFLYVLIIFLASIFLLSRDIGLTREKLQRRELAQRLNVNVDSPYLESPSFPMNFFWETLEPGMTIKEVHEIVKEYEQVLHCRRDSEVYYYYSKNADKALRFEVLYWEGKYSKLRGEDDSYRIHAEECVQGLLSEP